MGGIYPHYRPVELFPQNEIKNIFGYLILEMYVLTTKIHSFPGYLTDVSAIKLHCYTYPLNMALVLVECEFRCAQIRGYVIDIVEMCWQGRTVSEVRGELDTQK